MAEEIITYYGPLPVSAEALAGMAGQVVKFIVHVDFWDLVQMDIEGLNDTVEELILGEENVLVGYALHSIGYLPVKAGGGHITIQVTADVVEL